MAPSPTPFRGRGVERSETGMAQVGDYDEDYRKLEG